MSGLRKLLLSCIVTTILLAGWSIAKAEGQPETINGYVLDSACAFTKNLKKPISSDCAISCAKAGSPLVILTDNGTIYWPISGDTPAKGQNERLMEFAGKRVVVKGQVYQRGGSRAVVIATLTAAK